MRNILFVFSAIFCFFLASADNDKKEEFKEDIKEDAEKILDLNNQKKVKLIVDFSEASIHGLSEEDFEDYEPDFNKDRSELIQKIANSFNRKGKVKFLLGQFKETKYAIKVNIILVKPNGDTECEAEILDNEGDNIVTLKGIKGSGGTFGSKLNLMGDGCKSIGKELAKRTSKVINRAKKIKKDK